jgi:hypothetical protein
LTGKGKERRKTLTFSALVGQSFYCTRYYNRHPEKEKGKENKERENEE